jgi:UDP-N-acetylmuramyl pentapeptide synthase
MNNIFKKIVQFLLKWFAKIYLWRIKPHIIVIAGTTGRHWIKETVREALKEKNFPVRTNKKNFNAEIGLPLSILDLASGEAPKESCRLPTGQGSFWRWLKILFQAAKTAFRSKAPILKEFLVLEMAIDRPEGMNYLLSIVKPQTLILTTITMIYAENFENLDEIALEYKRLIKALPWNGSAILNFDDERVKNLAQGVQKRIVSYGFSKEADFLVENVRKVSDGQELKIRVNQRIHQRESALIKINRFGNHHIYAALVKEIVKESFKISAPDFFKQTRG